MYKAMLKKDLVAASAQPIVLTILARGESYGYAILSEVRRASDEELSWTDGMLYPVLRRMEERGLVRSRWGESDEGRRRRYYRITPAGRRSLEEDQRQWNLVNATLERLLRPLPST
jgi:DNA-binding PadR family transcriptional regulator